MVVLEGRTLSFSKNVLIHFEVVRFLVKIMDKITGLEGFSHKSKVDVRGEIQEGIGESR